MIRLGRPKECSCTDQNIVMVLLLLFVSLIIECGRGRGIGLLVSHIVVSLMILHDREVVWRCRVQRSIGLGEIYCLSRWFRNGLGRIGMVPRHRRETVPFERQYLVKEASLIPFDCSDRKVLTSSIDWDNIVSIGQGRNNLLYCTDWVDIKV